MSISGQLYRWFLLSTLPFCPFLHGQAVPLADALAAARYTLTVSDKGFSGAGAAVLTTALDGAQFVAIGEDHLTQEIPRFTAAVCDAMAPHGLNAVAFETSPAAASFVESTLGKPDRIHRMAALQRQYPESMPLLSDRQENDLAEHCAVAAKGQRFHLWGLDQEFLGAAGWMIQRMIDTHPGPKALAALTIMQSDEAHIAAEATRTGTLTHLYLTASTDAQISAAESAIRIDGAPATREIFTQLTASRSLYLEWAKDDHASDVRRATLLKQNFLKEYQAASKSSTQPRVLVKFGDSHMYRGFSDHHELNLGNFVSEWADVSGTRSLHIMVVGAEGDHAAYSRYGQPFTHSHFVLDQDNDYKWITAAIDARKDTTADGPWTLYDLRKLRFGRVANLDPSWQRVVYGYDLLVIIPEITPAELLQ
jgi:hypothetical protein